MATKLKLTEARVRDAAPGEYADEVEQGLMLYVSPTARTWGLYKWNPTTKKPIRKSIGKWPLITVDEARKRAKALALKLLDGESLTRPDTVTLEGITRLYTKANRARDLRYPDWIDDVVRLSFSDWAKRDLSTITKAEVAERHLEIASTRGRVVAARAVKALRALYKFADKHDLYTGRNVAKAVDVEDTRPRRRYLSPDEQARVRAALDDPSHAEWVKPFVRLAMLTGARRNNLASMRWADLDLDAGVFRVAAEHSKNKEPLEIVLPPEAVAILRERRATVTGQWVFPSPTSSSGHLAEPWYAIRHVYKLAGVEGATLHDLRRTLGSMLTQAGAPLSTVQRALGHKNPATTARAYSISSDASVREYMAKLNVTQINSKTGEDVTPHPQ